MGSRHYDLIIAGGGLAGLSLAHYLSRSSLAEKRVLVIDRDEKISNDHTWCFWSDTPSEFGDAIFHRWKTLWFHGSGGFSRLLDIGSEGLDYRMVRASDFYSTVIPPLKDRPSFEFLTAEVREIGNGEVLTDKGRFTAADLVFDSVTTNPYDNSRDHNLLQHFLGWVIEADRDVFDPDAATLFDFRVPQEGECRFVYILPETERRALVEFTVFSSAVLKKEEYGAGLTSYISEVLGVDIFDVVSEEQGVIPMSDAPHVTRPFKKVIRIGTAGGYVKPSTGYSFSRTQERLQAIVADLERGGDGSAVRFGGGWKSLLDSVLLDVLENRRAEAPRVFESLFKKNPPGRVLRFLDEKTGPADDLRIMSTVPLVPFTGSFVRELARRIFR